MVSVGVDYLTADFGFNGGAVGSIGDLVWADSNENGSFDVGEPGIGSVTIDLYDGGANLIATTLTDSNGAYDFTGVPPGTYTVQVTDLHGLLDELTLCAGTNPTAAIPVVGGTDYNDADFGYCSPSGSGILGDLIFLDEDGDGFFDAGEESGLAFTQIRLWYDTNGNCKLNPGFDTPLRTKYTDNSGRYFFQSLAPGSYLVEVIDPQDHLVGFIKTIGSIGVNEHSQPGPYCATLTATRAPSDLRADFGYRASDPYEISGTVFEDDNSNAVHNLTEAVVGGATVYLYRDINADGNIDPADKLMGTRVTGVDGNFAFGGLAGNNTHWILTTDVSGTSVSGATQTTQTATGGVELVLLAGASVADRDFGYAPPPTLALLSRFESVVDGGGVVVEWETVNEIGTDGFYLYRYSQAAEQWQQVADFVSSPGSPLGARYRVVDDSAAPGVTYDYVLVESEIQGGETVHGPFVATATSGSRAASTALGATPKERDGIHLARDRKPSNSRARIEIAGASMANATVGSNGIFALSATDLAIGLKVSATRVSNWIAEGQLHLTRDGSEIDWWTDATATCSCIPRKTDRSTPTSCTSSQLRGAARLPGPALPVRYHRLLSTPSRKPPCSKRTPSPAPRP